jgi:uncharacterized protein YndB with AHSA1/START domain
MIEMEFTTYLNRPVDQVYDFVINAENLILWQSGLVKSELLTRGPLRVGTRVRQVRMMGPKKSEVKAEITALEPNKRFTTKTITNPKATVDDLFEPQDGGTLLTYRFELHTSGLMHMFESQVKDIIQTDTNADLEKLKQILEA